MEDSGNVAYALEILLPEELETQFQQWALATPGATWPAWGGHVTLMNRFAPRSGIEHIRSRVATICACFAPFSLCLNRVITEGHWRRPAQHAVLLVSETRPAASEPIMRLHSALARSLARCRRDLQPEVTSRPFAPHISLTFGLPRREALQLVRVAREAKLVAEFTVQAIWLLEIKLPQSDKSKEILSARESFPLTGS
jgi:2'-5' RNA ligase